MTYNVGFYNKTLEMIKKNWLLVGLGVTVSLFLKMPLGIGRESDTSCSRAKSRGDASRGKAPNPCVFGAWVGERRGGSQANLRRSESPHCKCV